MPIQPAGTNTTETVNPRFWAQAVENRLIELIDNDEDLALWYRRPDMSSVVKSGLSGGYRAVPRHRAALI